MVESIGLGLKRCRQSRASVIGASASRSSASRYCLKRPSGSGKTFTSPSSAASPNCASGRFTMMDGCPAPPPSCENAASTTRPLAPAIACASAASASGDEGTLKSTSKAIRSAPASARRLISAPWNARDQGQVASFCRLLGSISTRTSLPLAGRAWRAKKAVGKEAFGRLEKAEQIGRCDRDAEQADRQPPAPRTQARRQFRSLLSHPRKWRFLIAGV